MNSVLIFGLLIALMLTGMNNQTAASQQLKN